jgi:hypothetical protein
MQSKQQVLKKSPPQIMRGAPFSLALVVIFLVFTTTVVALPLESVSHS